MILRRYSRLPSRRISPGWGMVFPTEVVSEADEPVPNERGAQARMLLLPPTKKLLSYGMARFIPYGLATPTFTRKA
ncbi:hypothetical protein D9M70_580880 [compost metagenome]